MSSLARPLRNALESTVKRGREIAEVAATEALVYLGVADTEAPPYLSLPQRAFRVQLRAHARQLGDALKGDAQETHRLAEEVAYEQWHRVLFTRFLVENNLLIHPELQEAISMADCEELAADKGKDPWQLASEYASRMLPQIFRPDDPTQRIELPVNRRKELATLVNGIDRETFLAKDALGWSYQFWQAKRKDEIDASGVKIGADELAAVTQLFTEDYMVEFLLHNSLGAWWVSNFSDKPLPAAMPYLRFIDEEVDDGHDGKAIVRRPAAGAFEGWPKHLKDFKLLDPCCGSGHFPVFALALLVPMRMELEKLNARDAVDAVLRENLHALELDARCVEIAVFAIALAAWTYPGAGGYRQLPELNVACCGLAISQKQEDWLKLANGDSRLKEGMQELYDVFKEAPVLGSLINPRNTSRGDLLSAPFEDLAPLLDAAFAKERIQSNAESVEAVLAARGITRAAALLSKEYTIQITNPPYLGRGNQSEALKKFCEKHYPSAKQDLANVFLERCLAGTSEGGTVQFVMPQNWLFLGAYQEQRETLLSSVRWTLLARLGFSAFDVMDWWAFGIILITIQKQRPTETSLLASVDTSTTNVTQEKPGLLLRQPIVVVSQLKQLDNPDARVTLEEPSSLELLQNYAAAYQGIASADWSRFGRCFWEVPAPSVDWKFQQSTVEDTVDFGGREHVLLWEDGRGALASSESARVQGLAAWGRLGVVVRQMGRLPATRYFGDSFDNNVAAVVPHNPAHLGAIWCYLSSSEYLSAVRQVDSKLNVTNATLVKVPFDIQRWSSVAQQRYPNGLPTPFSNDPTQWIFHGHPKPATSPLHVAVARLLGYRWPAECHEGFDLSAEARAWIEQAALLTKHADEDGVVCLPPVRGERSATDRLVSLLGDAFGGEWSSGLEAKLLADAGSPGTTLEAWLRDRFFSLHTKLFHDRPFIWHIWDGQRDGFGALVNYRILDKSRLESLAYSYLGDWIEQQQRRVAARAEGATILLAAAKHLQDKLKLILAGEPPCDIFVRWKPIERQPIGWAPDINDGVRLNVRPFMLCGDVGKSGAGILRDKPNISWGKDRGAGATSAPWFDLGPQYGEERGARINDHHTTLVEKRKSREAKS